MKIPITDENKKTNEESENRVNTSENQKEQEISSNDKNKDSYGEDRSQEELLSEYKEQLQRVQAEFINYRKRIEKERKNDFFTAKGILILYLLPVLDDFERLFEHYKGKNQCSLDEVEMIYNNLKKILSEQELTEIEDENCEFDPNYHEAIGIVETNAENDDRVMEVIQKGYKLGDKLLRPSRVRVGKYSEAKDEVQKDSDK